MVVGNESLCTSCFSSFFIEAEKPFGSHPAIAWFIRGGSYSLRG
jgi:hypothetical protein